MDLKLSLQEQATVTIYDKRTRTGLLDSTPVWTDEFSSLIFLDLPKEGEVVDVGCGTGRFIPILPDLNIKKYVGIDPSVASIEYCRQTYPEHQFSVGSLQTLGELYPNRFSGFIMTTTLMHIPRRSLSKGLQSLRKSLITGAHGMISLPIGAPLTWTTELGITLTLYTEAEMKKQLPIHGFCIRQMFSPSKQMLLIHAEAV